MVTTAKIEVKNDNLLEAARSLLKQTLESGAADAVLVPLRLPMKNMVMPALVADPERLNDADPLSPVFPINGAKLASKITRKSSGQTVVAVLRSCEVRAFVELVKLNQGRVENLVMIGIDCLGAYQNTDYFKLVENEESPEALTKKFVGQVLSGGGTTLDDIAIAPACRVCEHPVAESADITVGFYGVDASKGLFLEGRTEKGAELLKRLGLPGSEVPPQRKKAVADLVAERTAARDKMFAETAEATGSLEKLSSYLANCVNCYNCRVACPVCYCRECVFVTDVFDHEPAQYLGWAARKGAVKMPTDTLFYHLTRIAHMGTACVGCGQCSNACPNDIPVAELFRTAAARIQKGFDYTPGLDLSQKPPLSEFKENEFQDVVGLE